MEKKLLHVMLIPSIKPPHAVSTDRIGIFFSFIKKNMQKDLWFTEYQSMTETYSIQHYHQGTISGCTYTCVKINCCFCGVEVVIKPYKIVHLDIHYYDFFNEYHSQCVTSFVKPSVCPDKNDSWISFRVRPHSWTSLRFHQFKKFETTVFQ